MSNEKPPLFQAPPRLLLGVAFLFWGAMHERAVVGLLAAILMEGRHWTNLRWDFGVKGFARAWQLSIVALIVSTIGLIRAGDLTSDDFLNLLSWLPFMMLPLALAQQYSRAEGVPTVAFSFIARRKMEADKRAGRPVEIISVHLGYPFFLLVLITAGMGVGNLGRPEVSEWKYISGVLFLLGWAFLRLAGKRERPLAWSVAFAAAIVVAGMMLWGMNAAYVYLLKGTSGSGREMTSASETQTTLGEVGELQLSPQIQWRYFQEKGPAPARLKLAAYNQPYRNYWKVSLRGQELREQIADERSVGGDFEKMLAGPKSVFRYEADGRPAGGYRRVGRLLGLIGEEALVPHAAKTKRFEGVPADVLAVNSMGAFQMTGVNQGAMEVRLFSDQAEETIELDPTDEDLIYLESEADGLRSFLEEEGLQPPGDRAERTGSARRRAGSGKVPPAVSPLKFREIEGRLALAFQEKFQYSLFVTGLPLNQPISNFLNKGNRTGHCEYFAGATTMLLRRMGVPCRYVVGFSLQEKGGEREWILRGQHAHAWSQAYVGGTWVNEGTPDEPVWRCRGGEWVEVDLTPPDWSSSGTVRPWYQFLSDAFEISRAKLVVWVSDPAVTTGVKILVGVLVGPGLILLVYRLVTTRRREGGTGPGSWDELAGGTKLMRDFERWLGKRVGRRPVGVPMGSWLRVHLPDRGQGLIESYERVVYRGDGSEEELRELVREARLHWRDHQKTPEPEGSRG